MVEKSEASFRKLLRDMSDSQVRQYYRDLEWTAFPVLIIREYQKRFNAKNSKKIIDRLKTQTEVAKQQSDVLRKIATSKGGEISSKLIRQASDTVSSGITSAKKMTYNPEKSLEILEKLAALNKKGVISNKEFQDKKREILKKI